MGFGVQVVRFRDAGLGMTAKVQGLHLAVKS